MKEMHEVARGDILGGEVVFWCRTYRRNEAVWAEQTKPMHAEHGQKWNMLPWDVFLELSDQKQQEEAEPNGQTA